MRKEINYKKAGIMYRNIECPILWKWYCCNKYTRITEM